jgi:hypothetical protein
MIKLILLKIKFERGYTMHVNKLLQNMFSRSRIILDKRLHRVVLEAAETLSYFKQLSIVGLGLSLQRKANVKYNIKKRGLLEKGSSLRLALL